MSHYYDVLLTPEIRAMRRQDRLPVAENLICIEDELAAILDRNRPGVWLPEQKEQQLSEVAQFALDLARRFQINEAQIRTLIFRIHRVAVRAGQFHWHFDKRSEERKEADWLLAQTVLLREAKFICEYLAAMPMPKGKAKSPSGKAACELN